MLPGLASSCRMPTAPWPWFASEEDAMSSDYKAATTSAVLFEVSARTKIELRGQDRASFLHNFCTQDINRLPIGQGCEALLLNVQARILAYVRVFARQDSLWLDSEPGLGPKIVQHLDRYLITEQVELIDCTQEFTQYCIAGPRSQNTLEQLCAVELSGWQDLQHAEASIAGISCQLRKNRCLSVEGYDLVFAATHDRTIHDALTQAGAIPAGLDVCEVLRIEAGTPAYGQDIDESNLPQELGRDGRVLSFTKGCYLGQEPVVRIRDLGHVNRILMAMKVEGDVVPPAGAKVLHGGQEIGNVTSAAFSPRLGSAVALAYIRRGHQQPGTAVTLDDHPAVVAALPFV
jgi:folate-binding protein YgfZ